MIWLVINPVKSSRTRTQSPKFAHSKSFYTTFLLPDESFRHPSLTYFCFYLARLKRVAGGKTRGTVQGGRGDSTKTWPV